MRFQTRYQKTDVALTQLESAIVAYKEGKHIEAITLAGASEGILGEICRRQNLPNSLEKIVALPRMQECIQNNMEKFMSESKLNKEGAKKEANKKAITDLNKARNCLKHASEENEDEFEIAEDDAYFLIVRAILNMMELGIKETPVIRGFCWR